jgi:toxin-antitoxin system PIN domain toxin
MILIDANLLLYAYNTSSPEHPRAAAWLEGVLSGDAPVGLCWTTISAFLRISTNPRAFTSPLTAEEAVKIVDAWLAVTSVVTLTPGERHWPIFRRLISDGRVRGPMVTDAHLAALALEHDATLCSNDHDFARFAGLKTFNPLL